MTLAKAIAALRKKLQYTQAEFAESLRVKPVTISRYENGRQPRGQVTKRLADLAEQAGAPHLRDLFEATWKGAIVSKIDNLPSAGAERRIPKDSIEIWMSRQENIFRACTGLVKKGSRLTPAQCEEVLEGIRKQAERTWGDLRTFLRDTVPELDPNEDFDNPLHSLFDPPDWMRCLYDPPSQPRLIGSRRRRQLQRSKGGVEPT